MSLAPKNTPRRTGLPVWWLASLLFHALLFGWLLFFSPVRVIDLTAKPANLPPNVSLARAAEIMRQVRQQEAARLAEEVRALEAARRETAALDARLRYELWHASSNAAAAVEKIATAQDKAARAQATAQTVLSNAAAQLLPGQSNLLALTNLTAAIGQAQAGASQFQTEALEALAAADPKFEPAYEAQAQANVAQTRAAQSQAEAQGQLSGASEAGAKKAPQANELRQAEGSLRTAESELALALSNSVALSNRVAQLRADAAAAKTTLDTAQTAGDKTRMSAARKQASETQKTFDNGQRNLARAQNDIRKFQQRVTEQAARVAKMSAKAGLVGTSAEARRPSAAETLRETQRLQSEALAAQLRAAQAFSDARKGGVLAPLDQSPQAEDLAGVYQSAVQTEGELAEAYRRLRATDLARQRQISLGRALELTDAARPARPDLAASLSGSPASAPEAAAQRQAMLEARLQITAMRSLADSILAQARSLGAEPARQQSLEQLAAEDENQRAKDLSGAMRRGAGSGSGQPGAGQGGASSRTSVAGQSNGPGKGPGSGPPAMPQNLAAVAGRVIGAGPVPGRWMFVDSWYLLGPFDNTGRANIERQFPPETVVDLNASYVGKRGRPIHWEFYQSPQPGVVPPFDGFNPLPNRSGGSFEAFVARDLEYIIYYAYTELRAAEECDVWVAVGSDDYSKLWLEDQLVWASGKQHKNWRVDEGFRKVRLKPGVNRVLFRVENGHGQTEFSLAVCGQ